MEQEKIKYGDIMSFGFTETKEDDPIYFDDYGFNYCIVQLDLTNEIYLDWAKETQLCELVRIDNKEDCNVKNKVKVKNLKQLKEIVDFFTD